jgi:ABC-type branched-subunit amino acid transport system substrate-binding protein
VPPEALTNVYGTMYRSLMWTDTTSPGPRQVAFAKKVATFYPEGKGSGVPVANSPFYDFLHVLKLAIEGEKSFEPEKVKRALDSVKGYQGLLGTINFTPENHTAIGIDDIALASVASGKDQKRSAFSAKWPRGMDLDLLVGYRQPYALVAMGFNIPIARPRL